MDGIKGERVILRKQAENDAMFFANWYNRSEVMFRCGFTEPTSPARERERILTDHRSDDSVWFTVTDTEGEILGETGLLRMFPAWHCTDLSIIIPDPAKRRRGYGTEAVRLMLDLAFGRYGMNRVAIGVVERNEEALAFYEKIGFRREGVQEEGYLYDGQYSDFVMMRILRREWEEQGRGTVERGNGRTGFARREGEHCMDFMELTRARYSVRKFDSRPIEEEKLTKILEAGNAAPTAKNLQPQRIYVVRSEENMEKIRTLTICHFGAPVVLLFAYDRDEEWQNPLEEGVHSGPQDVSIVATHIMLQAAELGIGSCWVNRFPPTETARVMGLPENEVPLLLMPLGYPAEDAEPAPRHTEKRPLHETVRII